jgi:hypothetical protein
MRYVLLMPLVFSLMAGACGPSDFERQKLAFEEQKYKDEQAAKAEAVRQEAEDKQQQTNRWSTCRLTAEQEFNHEVKVWGEPVPGKPGLRNGPANQLQDMKNRLQRKNEQCDRNFPKGISWSNGEPSRLPSWPQLHGTNSVVASRS